MKKQKFKGDTNLGRLLQKRADKKREDEEIEAYLKLKSDGLSKEQFTIALQELLEKYAHQ